jgi:Leucine-rich repeat (LRR) protein
LDLSSCSIQSLPEEIGELCSLQAFNLGGNPLTALPDSIGQLTQLESLDLGGTNLTEFPDNIVGLAALTELDLSSTRLESLPATIGQLKSLRSLILPVGIKEVPRELAHLRNLKKMMIGDHYSSDDSSTTRIILNLCRQLVAESRSGRSR